MQFIQFASEFFCLAEIPGAPFPLNLDRQGFGPVIAIRHPISNAKATNFVDVSNIIHDKVP